MLVMFNRLQDLCIIGSGPQTLSLVSMFVVVTTPARPTAYYSILCMHIVLARGCCSHDGPVVRS